MMLIERAHAKVNLTLRVNCRRADGYHDLESLVAFASAADLLTLTPGPALSLRVEGPTAAAAGDGDGNLVLKAARELAAGIPHLASGAFHLEKRLPVAAGLGGGSSDAAAALRLLARANGLALDDARVLDAARRIGSDVPVCLESRARAMRGAGELLGPQLNLPPLFAVLVNPGVGVSTPQVFARLGLQPGEVHGFGKPPAFADGMPFDAMIAALRKGRNDLEDAAIFDAPAISHVLAVIAAAPGCRLARMSGSGATCFGLFATRSGAIRAARVIRRDNRNWWATAVLLR